MPKFSPSRRFRSPVLVCASICALVHVRHSYTIISSRYHIMLLTRRETWLIIKKSRHTLPCFHNYQILCTKEPKFYSFMIALYPFWTHECHNISPLKEAHSLYLNHLRFNQQSTVACYHYHIAHPTLTAKWEKIYLITNSKVSDDNNNTELKIQTKTKLNSIKFKQ